MASQPKHFVGKKTNKQTTTNKNLCSRGNSLRNNLCFNFWIIWCKVSFLTQYIEWIIVSFDISVFFLRVQHLIMHRLVYQFSHSVQSEEEKRILKQKKPLESMDNDITETDYKGEKKNTISPLYNWHLDLHFHINHHINLISTFVLGGATPLCKTCTVVCHPKGYGFSAVSCLTTGIDFAHLDLEWGMVFEGLSY